MKGRTLKVIILVILAAASAGLTYSDISLAQPATVLQSAFVDGRLPVTDPGSNLWALSSSVEMPLSGQTVELPFRLQPATPSVDVQSLNNRTHIAFRLSWSDSTVDNRTTRATDFRDAAAIMLASSTLPGICMGSRGQQAHIVQWKADWQADVEEGFKDLQDTFPNFWVDEYPWAVGDPPYRLPEAFPAEARDLLVGWSVGNPFSDPLKVTAVEDAVATGFGTIATQDRQDAVGRGVWRNGEWSVVISRKLETGDSQDQPIAMGQRYNLAFAVWEGSSGDVGARKSVSSWVTMGVSSPPTALGVDAWVIGLVMVPPAAAILTVFYIMRRKRGT